MDASRFSYLVPIVSVLTLAGAALYSAVAPSPAPEALSAAEGRFAEVEGVIAKDPDIRDTSIFLTVDVESVDGGASGGRILVLASRYAEVAYGDRIRVTGKLEVPQAFDTDTGRTFDYPHYLLAQGITHEMSFANVETVARGEGNPLVAALYDAKHFLERGIAQALPEPESALASGLLLGDKRSLGDNITESFRRAGVVHIIVLSGYNVSIIIGAVMFLALRFLPKYAALGLASVSIIAFAIMTGASETTLRASAMALIALVAKALNRPADGVRILLMTAAGMALFDPYLVLYDLSYQLSFLATLGLTLFADPMQKKMPFVPGTGGLREIVATTVSTQLTVLPLLIFSTGQVSVISLFTNIAVLPAVPLAMLASFIAALLALASYAFALPVITIAYAILHYVISVAVWFGNLPFAAFVVPAESAPLVLSALALIYSGCFLAFVIRRNVFQRCFRSGS